MININQVKLPDRDYEISQRKGIGQADSLCDGIAEAILHAFDNIYKRDYGESQPAQIDDVRIKGGITEPEIGSEGKIKEASTIIVHGTVAPCSMDIDEVVSDAIIDYLGSYTPFFDINNIISCVIEGPLNPPESEKNTFKRSKYDYGIGYGTSSMLDNLVYYIESTFFKEARDDPDSPLGYDVIVTGTRQKDVIDIDVQCAMIAVNLENEYDYERLIDEIKELLGNSIETVFQTCDLDYKYNLNVNKDSQNITLMGTCAESIDGYLRRGNAVNGIINPAYPNMFISGMDAHYSAVKNYAVFSSLLSEIICSITDAKEVGIFIMNDYDKPILEPKLINVNIDGERDDQRITDTIEGIFEKISVSQLTTF